MKKTAFGVVLCSLFVAPAYAGTVSDSAVYIGTNFASGSLKTARLSGDLNQYIGCYTFQPSQLAGGSFGVSCFARDSAGTYRSCLAYDDSAFLYQAQSITYRSNMFFVWDSNGLCTYLNVQNSSDYQ